MTLYEVTYGNGDEDYFSSLYSSLENAHKGITNHAKDMQETVAKVDDYRFNVIDDLKDTYYLITAADVDSNI